MPEQAQRILELFDRRVDRHIEEIIKVDQADAEIVREEIEEYVITDAIRRHYERFLERYRETPNKPHEGVGVWVSGFFGAGKSSFAKILGYVLEDRDLAGTSAAQLFSRQTADPGLQALVDAVNRQIPAKAVIFNVATDQAVTDASEKLTDVVYRVLLRELGYATDREIAELEITLEAQDRLAQFEETFEKLFDGRRWAEVKNQPVWARNMASRVIHELDPETYPHPDTWARTPHPVTVTARFVAERTFELMQRRGGGRALVFVIDEVGQYVARSTEKMLDLQGLVEQLGKVGRDRAREWKGQVWLVATSQERLTEVVDNLEGKQVELARLKDRFPIEIDLAPSDIREVTAQRVLKKKPEAKSMLQALFAEHRGKLREATRLTGRLASELELDGFSDLYPFLPYQVELIIDIVSGLRTQAGASKHVGGAVRTIIKIAQQVLINERTALGREPVGRLVTLDLVYELLEGMVTSERRRDVDEIQAHFGADALPTRVAKALALLQFVKGLHRSPEHLAALLHPAVDAATVLADVERALGELAAVGKVRETEEGWELLSRVGKDWEEERRGIEVFPRDRAELSRSAAEQVFGDVVGYRHRGLRTFTALPVVDGHRVGRSGDVELRVRLISDPATLEVAREKARQESNTDDGRNAVHWVVPLAEDLVSDLDELHRSREMVRRHEREKLAPEQQRLLHDEKARAASIDGRLAAKLRRAFAAGDSYFQGVHTRIQEYGGELRDAVRAALQEVVPKLFAKFDLAAVPVKADDARRIVESDSLAGLPPVYYDGADGLALVRRQGGEHVIDAERPAAAEVMEFIRQRRSYGEEATGKALENRFTGFGYGWDLEVVMLIAATLLRAGRVEVYSGRRYTSYVDPGVREVFRKTPAFRGARFSPRQGPIDFQKLTECAQAIERLYGVQVAIEEGAIAATIRSRLPDEALRARAVLNLLEANDLPGGDVVRELAETLGGVTEGGADDVVLAFHEQRDAIAAGLGRVKKLEAALAAKNLDALRRARAAVQRLWPDLTAVDAGDTELEATVHDLQDALGSSEFFEHLPAIAQRAQAVWDVHADRRRDLATRLLDAVGSRLDDLRNRPEWEALPEESQAELRRPFERIEAKAHGESAGLSELESELRALDAVHAEAVARLIELYEARERPDEEPTAPVVHRIRASRFASRGLRTPEEVEEAVGALRDACLDAVNRGETVVLE